MTLAQFFAVVRRRRWWIVLTVGIGIGSGVVVSALQVPQFRAESSVFVSVGGATVTDLTQGGTFSEARVASYVQLAQSPRVLSAAAHRAGVRGDVAVLRSKVQAEAVSDTVILSISATDTDQAKAASLANAVAHELVEAVAGIERTDDHGRPLVELSVFQQAQEPSRPISPRPAVNAVLGVIGGLGSGIAIALVLETVDTKLRSVEALRQIGKRSVLAEIPVDPQAATSPLIDVDNRYSERAEQFRQLRTHLTFTNVDGGSQAIVVTSALPGEGKSSTAVNLSLMLAQSGHRVVLVDADLRRPSTGDYLGLESGVGLSTVLTHQVELADALQRHGADELHVLASGRVPPNPSELLESRTMEVLIADLHQHFDYVIIDAPPVLPVTDPTVLATRVNGVLFVASVDGRVTSHAVQSALGRLDAVGARVVGTVANRVRLGRKTAQYYGYQPTAPRSERPRRSRKAVRARMAEQ
ncbi:MULTISPECIES: polysaccharide biosynthesis tyrosine autokinase [unclassified Curtobacterium]|uniref:polysaccharide biosynthesis tyrosine autokinase n=1 Tax=unclassified Curtobacterium TaxID=257496 RepID=UPI000D93AB2D|nr:MULTISPECIES: polysaccharide biosynthesis tyrosine autokinase [unclassified Curtobacterium]PYY39094.1 chromosome partitioning protein [Curtobacterium sp. MCPF17_046]WIB15953.1 polysaccharide biosynthesis tyrosine autokinase [Curtobacterium sp. MCPF17_050]